MSNLVMGRLSVHGRRRGLALLLCAAFFILAVGSELQPSSGAFPESDLLARWEASWTPYQIVDEQSVRRRLAKAVIHFPEQTPAGMKLRLYATGGNVLDEESIPPGKKGTWAHGFWIPVQLSPSAQMVLELWRNSRPAGRRSVAIAGSRSGSAAPLRLDQLGRELLAHLVRREAPFLHPEADVVEYLRQHDIVYRSPSKGWDEGLPLGNGDVGALVAGVQGEEQTLFFDKTDLWLATRDEKPLGRTYAGTLRIRYSPQSREPAFEQRLSLGQAEVLTRDGDVCSSVRVHALHNVIQVEIEAAEVELHLERPPVPLWDPRASRLYGSWAALTTPAELDQIRSQISAAPHSQVVFGFDRERSWFVHEAPNIRCAVALAVRNGRVQWRKTTAAIEGLARAAGKAPLQIEIAIATSREDRKPLARALRLLSAKDRASHLQWWQNFWRRSWIELPDKLEENLWYLGVYQQAACSRSDQAVSFFGLWHPLDLRTWSDAYVIDNQVEMMWWVCFSSNHLELLYPSHRTFARIVPEFLEHTPGTGLVVPHWFQPEWAGGHGGLTGTNPYKGSSAWYALNFWWDYLYSGDEKILREITYPLLRMTADYFVSDLVKESDGRYHCLDSGSPEQSNTARDNIYDWTLLQGFFKAAVPASEILQIDEPQRRSWQERLDHLFPCPTDGQTLSETPVFPHPYRCHPVVFFGLYPTLSFDYGSDLFRSAARTLPVVTRLVGFRYEDRHETIPGFEGGVEPNGFSSGILAITAARLGDYEQYRRFLYGLIIRFHLKQNGLRALNDTRQSSEIARASLVEAANSHTVATTETLLQSWGDHLRIFPCISSTGLYRFSGLRAMGGFVISAEARDGKIRWIQITAHRKNTLRLALPLASGWTVREKASRREVPVRWSNHPEGGSVLELPCDPGVSYDLVAEPNQEVDFKLPRTQPRTEPRTISIDELHPSSSFVHYPETLPFGQISGDEFLYLGRPAKFGAPRTAPDWRALLQKRRSENWQERQSVARVLGDGPISHPALETLDELCDDPVSVVAHTAAVSLLRLRDAAAVALAKKHASKNRVPGLQREVEKALRRYRIE